MTQEERLDFLISQLLCESAEYKDIPVPTAQEEKRQLLRALMNVRPRLAPQAMNFFACRMST